MKKRYFLQQIEVEEVHYRGLQELFLTLAVEKLCLRVGLDNFAAMDRCELQFIEGGPYWHLCTPGNISGMIFSNEEDFKFGISLLALALFSVPGLKLLTFALMNNHLHLAIEGPEERAEEFWAFFLKHLRRYLRTRNRTIADRWLEKKLIHIEDLRQLRNTIAYVNRNGYVSDCNHTPFSYPWSGGRYMFNGNLTPEGKEFASMTLRERRSLFAVRNPPECPSMIVSSGYVSPLSFCAFARAQGFFTSAHHYFSILTKQMESYSEIATSVGDLVFMVDEELKRAAVSFSHKKYGTGKLNNLAISDKVEVANYLHFECHASNESIRRVLFLTASEVNSLFPKSTDRKAVLK